MKRLLLVVLALPSVALAQPTMPKKVRLPDPPADVAALLADAIRAKDAKAILPLLRAKGTLVRNVWFPDVACRKHAKYENTAKKPAELKAIAACLAKLELQPTTRKPVRSSTPLLTYAPGIELQLGIEDGTIHYLGHLHHGLQGVKSPTLTAQAFEALRTAGSTNVDAAVAAKLEPEVKQRGHQVAAWVETCLDAKGAAKTTVSEATNDEIGKIFVAATADWKFKPFTDGKQAMPVCAQTLLTYPAAKAPATEMIPDWDVPSAWLVDQDGEAGGVEGGVVGGVAGGGEWVPGVGWQPGSNVPPPPPPPPPPAPPQNVAPTLLESLRVAGDKNIVPDDLTKLDIAKSKKDRIIGSFKLCVAESGMVKSVTMLKSTGFASYDTKLQSRMRLWQYKPYQVNGKAVPVCTAVTFIYSQVLPAPKKAP